MPTVAESAHPVQSSAHQDPHLPSLGEVSHGFADAAEHFRGSAFRPVSAVADGIDTAIGLVGDKEINLGKIGKLGNVKLGTVGGVANAFHLGQAWGSDNQKFGRNTADALGGLVGSTLGGIAGKAGGMSAGSMIGGVIGGAFGGAVGSSIGPVGTVGGAIEGAEIGSSIGAIAGTAIGSFAGGRVGEALIDTLMTLKK